MKKDESISLELKIIFAIFIVGTIALGLCFHLCIYIKRGLKRLCRPFSS